MLFCVLFFKQMTSYEMRISDWSSDVCSSDLAIGVFGGCYMDTYLMWNLCSDPAFLADFITSIQVGSLQTELGNDKDYLATRVAFTLGLRGPAMTLQTADRKSVVEGKSVSVRVDLGGRRSIKKKTKDQNKQRT